MAIDNQTVIKELAVGSHAIRVQAKQICFKRRVFVVQVSAALVALLPTTGSEDGNLPAHEPGARVIIKERENDDADRADQYDTEVAMYTTRLGPLQGRCVPRLFGQLTSGPAMLLEYIKGAPLHKLSIAELANPRVLDVVRARYAARDPDMPDIGMSHGYGFELDEWVRPDLLRALRRVFDSLTACGVVHGDAKLANFMLRAPSESSLASGSAAEVELPLVAIDFGCAHPPGCLTNEHELLEVIYEIKRLAYDEVAPAGVQRAPASFWQWITPLMRYV